MQPGHDQREHRLLQRRGVEHQGHKFAFTKLFFHHLDNFIELCQAADNRSNILFIHDTFGVINSVVHALSELRIIIHFGVH
ncbi:MAG: hypothetical protein BWY90_01282 [Deltaproteobacteria bacterium ADurb.BinA014]|nr:MAG: hypothetical protein BWY90_01282 [Deltaproteobacteria bacterium ADurb.BinA014]